MNNSFHRNWVLSAFLVVSSLEGHHAPPALTPCLGPGTKAKTPGRARLDRSTARLERSHAKCACDTRTCVASRVESSKKDDRHVALESFSTPPTRTPDHNNGSGSLSRHHCATHTLAKRAWGRGLVSHRGSRVSRMDERHITLESFSSPPTRTPDYKNGSGSLGQPQPTPLCHANAREARVGSWACVASRVESAKKDDRHTTLESFSSPPTRTPEHNTVQAASADTIAPRERSRKSAWGRGLVSHRGSRVPKGSSSCHPRTFLTLTPTGIYVTATAILTTSVDIIGAARTLAKCTSQERSRIQRNSNNLKFFPLLFMFFLADDAGLRRGAWAGHRPAGWWPAAWVYVTCCRRQEKYDVTNQKIPGTFLDEGRPNLFFL